MSQISDNKDIDSDLEDNNCEDSNRYPKKLCRAGTPRPKDFKESINAALTSLGISKLHLNDAIASRQLKHNQDVTCFLLFFELLFFNYSLGLT